MLTITEMDNGDLLLQAGNETRQAIAAMLANEHMNYYMVMRDLFETYSCNGSYTPFSAEDANPFVGLTSAPCIAETMDYDNEGNREIVGNFWYFPDYMVVSELEQLKNQGRCIFTLAR